MAALSVGVILVILAAASALPTDHVISKLDPGPRYQYMSGPDGPELVDLWMKTSDVLAAARYNPDDNNGYHLFTRSNPSISQPVPLGAASILQASNFDANKKTVFLVHGWRNTPLSDFNVHLVHAYLTAEDVNLIMVDWSIGAGVNYITALSNCIRSGEHVARFISWLNSASGSSLANYHIIGHSLGAHQAGIIGRHLGGGVAYISGSLVFYEILSNMPETLSQKIEEWDLHQPELCPCGRQRRPVFQQWEHYLKADNLTVKMSDVKKKMV